MQTILIQLDTDNQASIFDRVVAIDSGVAQIFSCAAVTPETVTALVHGAIFTRGPADLKHTAIFIGGSSAAAGEALQKKVLKAFFGPLRVSVMMDSNGCNTTAAAAIATARKHMPLTNVPATVLGATGPVGLRAAELLAAEGAQVTLVSRTQDRAKAAAETIRERVPQAIVVAGAAADAQENEALCRGAEVVVAAGAAGACLLSQGALQRLPGLKLAIDLNAVPPLGLADVSANDKGVTHHGVLCYGALGVGGLKMKVHRQCVASLFEASDRVLDTQAIYEVARRTAGITT